MHTFQLENQALRREVKELERTFAELEQGDGQAPAGEALIELRRHFNALMDVEKHYQRKENLVFPFLEKHSITGPPTVMWGKHDETRELLASAIESLEAAGSITAGELRSVIDLVLRPAVEAVSGMIDKEEQILLPMCLDTLTDEEWHEVAKGSDEIGYCLAAPGRSYVVLNPEPGPFDLHLAAGTYAAEWLDVVDGSTNTDRVAEPKGATRRFDPPAHASDHAVVLVLVR